MDDKMLVRLIAGMVAGDAKMSPVEPTQLPLDVASAATAWEKKINLAASRASTTELCYLISSKAFGEIHVIDYSGDDPDPFRAIALFKGAALLSESVEVAR